MRKAANIRCQTLVVHAREDELTSLRSANFLVEKIGGARARMVVLEDSYHMVCVDNDREIVAKNVLEFFGAPMPGATSILANEPKMTPAELVAAVDALSNCLAKGDFTQVRALGIPDMAWIQPGINRVAGAHAGKAFASFASRLQDAAGGPVKFTAFGTPVFNRGIALVPSTLVALRDGVPLESQGALLCAWHAGKLLEVRWFADDVEGENQFFGPPDPTATGPSALEQAFESATAASRTLKATDNDTLLALYALYKQASVGDVSGDRPGALDMVARAKYDAWAKKRGMPVDEAMRNYVALVDELKRRETVTA
jgi:carboxylesterase